MNQVAFRVACVVCACAMGTAAQAQTNRAVDVGVAYSFLRITEESGVNMPVGWLVSVAGRATNVVSIVGEVAGNYKSEEGETLRIHTFQAGVRFLARQNPNVTPWGQFLLGGANASGGCCGESETKFSIEPGGGVDVPVGGRVAMRLGVGFPMVFVEGETFNTFRVQVGLVF